MRHIQLIQGDITTARVDAIVNAANPVMLGGGGVDGAIHRAAGEALLRACREVPAVDGMRCPPGEARITAAGSLPAPYVIHTVGPVYACDPQPAKTLRSAYDNSLQLALQHDCRSIAFPAISCGVYGYPLDEAARIAIDTCSQNCYRQLQIQFYLFGESTWQAWQDALIKSAQAD